MEEINTVNVLSINEEKLKFRVSVSFFGQQLAQNQGEYKFLLPIPTSLANSNEYNSCIMECSGFQAYALSVVGDPAWTSAVALSKVGTLELQLDVPSSQTTTTTSLVAADSGVGNSRVGGYRELIFMECVSIGDNVGGVAIGGSTASWRGKSSSTPVLCGNPFGKTISIRNSDPISDDLVWLISAAAGAGTADRGCYIYSFEITMVPNK
jgi:hypothetical protein